MSPHSELDDLLAAEPLSPDQARWLTLACPSPLMVADVVDGGFTVVAADALLRRFVVGARHPAGPAPGEILDVDGMGALGPAMAAAAAFPGEQQVMELPIGDEPLWFEVTVTATGDEHGVRQLILMARDHTAAREIERRERRSANRFQAMVTHAPGLILLVDSTGRIIRCSPGVDRLLGVAAHDLTGRAVFELMHPDTLARAASVFNQILSQPGEPIPIHDFRMSHTSGTSLWCEAVATNLLHDEDVAAIVINAHDITERRLAEERLELAATSDALTGLANRRRLEARLDDVFEDPARLDRPVGLALTDLDDFKLVNDALGHEIGDGVLRALASRLEGIIAGRGAVARVGGDEFALLLEEVRASDELDRLADAIHEALRTPVRVGDHDVFVRASVGTSTATLDHADPAALMRSADLALYRAKRNGKNRTVRFTAELQLEAEQRLATITALQQAIRDGRLRLAYQPVVLVDGSAVGAEALLRWEHDGRLLSPAHFLELAEDTGLILPIGTWVLEQVCRDLGTLAGPDGVSWVSVNLSSRQLLDERLPFVVRRTLDAHGVDASSLAVEISESTLRDEPAVSGVLADLGGVGVLLALDDLAHDQQVLTRLGTAPIRAVKLDRGFVSQLDIDPEGRHRTLAAAVLELAAEHGVDVIAEGVETETQAQVLRDLGCPMQQGYLHGAPQDLASFLTRP